MLFNGKIRPQMQRRLKGAKYKELILMKGIAEIDPVLLEKKCYTYEDYAKLPEGARYQLIGGQLIMTPAPSTYHQEISKHLEYLLYEYGELRQKLGKVYYAPVDVYLEDEETYQPDIIFISNNRLDIIKKEKIEGAPDIIIEQAHKHKNPLQHKGDREYKGMKNL